MSNTLKYFVQRDAGVIKYHCMSYENTMSGWELIDPNSQEFKDYLGGL